MNLVWDMLLYQVAKRLETSIDYIKKWCDEWGIIRPDPQYFPKLMRRKLEKN